MAWSDEADLVKFGVQAYFRPDDTPDEDNWFTIGVHHDADLTGEAFQKQLLVNLRAVLIDLRPALAAEVQRIVAMRRALRAS